MKLKALSAFLLASLSAGVFATGLPKPDHVVVVIEENRAFSNIIGYANAPYINNTLVPMGALMTQSYAIDGSSQPNYLQLFSGSNQGVFDNTVPQSFTTPNLRSALAEQGYSFTGYAETLPSVGYTGADFTTNPNLVMYERKHNPWVNWQDAASNGVPAAENQPFSNFPTDFSQLPTVSFVVPNEQNNMHDGSRAAGDLWLKNNLDAYAQWAMTHNSLLILTWDEDDGNHNGQITTLLVGQMVIPGQYSQTINHLNVLRTLEEMYGTAYLGDTASVGALTGMFQTQQVPLPASLPLMLSSLGLLAWSRKRPS